MTLSCVGLGANLGDPHAALLRASEALETHGGRGIVARSSIYRSAAIGPGEQEDYLNAAVTLHWTHQAEDLLALLHRIEAEAGRIRAQRWGPRTLDLDLLTFGPEQLHSATLTVPHPRITSRNFVLLPMIDVLGGDTRIDGRTLEDWLRSCPTNPIERTSLAWHGAPSRINTAWA